MEVKIIAQENFQTVEMEVSVESIDEVSNWLYQLRMAIKEATADVGGRSQQNNSRSYNNDRGNYGNNNYGSGSRGASPTVAQIAVFRRNNIPDEEWQGMTPQEASALLDSYGIGTSRR